MDDGGNWGLLSVFFLYLFLSELLTQISLVYHITQTAHDLLLKWPYIKLSKLPFWKLMILVCISLSLLTLVTFISVSTFQILNIRHIIIIKRHTNEYKYQIQDSKNGLKSF